MTAIAMRRRDEEIQWAVAGELEWDTSVGPNEIAVTVKDGVVTLGGWIDAFTTKSAANATARRVAGVKAVVDEMELRRSGSPQRASTGTAAPGLEAVDWDTILPFEVVEISAPDANLYEHDHCYILQVPLPGMTLDQFTINARDQMVTLQGTIELPAPEGARAIFQNTSNGKFREVVALPGDADAEHSNVEYQDGVLTLTLPKAQYATV
jgi:HSP20 family molecular chaperone IbpA